jgi:hypothetical protein
MKSPFNIKINVKTRTLLFNIATVLVASTLLMSCGNYGGGGMYGGMSTLPPAAFSLSSPANGATGVSLTPDLMWGSSLYAMGYYVYLKKDTDASYTLIQTMAAPTTSFTVSPALTASTVYDWYVTAFNNTGMVSTGTGTFTTGP